MITRVEVDELHDGWRVTVLDAATNQMVDRFRGPTRESALEAMSEAMS